MRSRAARPLTHTFVCFTAKKPEADVADLLTMTTRATVGPDACSMPSHTPQLRRSIRGDEMKRARLAFDAVVRHSGLIDPLATPVPVATPSTSTEHNPFAATFGTFSTGVSEQPTTPSPGVIMRTSSVTDGTALSSSSSAIGGGGDRRSRALNLMAEIERMQTELQQYASRAAEDSTRIKELEEALAAKDTVLMKSAVDGLDPDETITTIPDRLLEQELTELQDEVDEYQALLRDSMAEIVALRAQLERSKQAHQYLQDAMADYEEESKAQAEEIKILQATRVENERRSSTSHKQAVDSQRDVRQLESSLKIAQASLTEARNELHQLRKDRTDSKLQIEELRTLKLDADQRNEQLLGDMDRLGQEEDKLRTNYLQLQSKWQDRELEIEKSIASLQRENFQLRQGLAVSAVNTVDEAGKLQSQISTDSSADVQDLTRIIQLARNMLIEDLRSSASSVQITTLPLVDLVKLYQRQVRVGIMAMHENFDVELNMLRADKLDLKEALENQIHQWESSHAQLQAQLNDRNALLERVMRHIMGQMSSSTVENADSAIAGMVADYEQLCGGVSFESKVLHDMDADLDAAFDKVSSLEKQIVQLRAAKHRAESDAQSKASELEQLARILREKTDLLTSTMAQQKKHVTARYDDELQVTPFEVAVKERMTHEHQRTLDALLEGERLAARVRELEAQLASLNNHADQARYNPAPEPHVPSRRRNRESAFIPSNSSLADELAQIAGGDSLKVIGRIEDRDMIANLTAQLKEKSDELDELRRALIGSHADLEAAGSAGLSLIDMIARLKDNHQADVNTLQSQLDALNRQLQDLITWKPSDNSTAVDGYDGDGDVLKALKNKLTRAYAREKELLAILDEYDRERKARTEVVQKMQNRVRHVMLIHVI